MENMVNFNWSSLNISRDEAAARGSQIKSMLGVDDATPITTEQLKFVKDNAEKLVVQYDNMQDFLDSITDFDAAADWLSKHAYPLGGALLLGIVKHPKGWRGM